MDTPFRCRLCQEELPAGTYRVFVYLSHDAFCGECFEDLIKPRFEESLQDETKNPPLAWKGYELQPDELLIPAFSKDFMAAYDIKQIEYDTPKVKRIYCNNYSKIESETVQALIPSETHATDPSVKMCGNFMQRVNRDPGNVDCKVCHGTTCSKCGEPTHKELGEHICPPKIDPDAALFADKIKGKDYQACPGCDVRYELMDGCNHTICTDDACREGFCFICGEPAAHSGGHWLFGRRCPLYGQPSADTSAFAPLSTAIYKMLPSTGDLVGFGSRPIQEVIDALDRRLTSESLDKPSRAQVEDRRSAYIWIHAQIQAWRTRTNGRHPPRRAEVFEGRPDARFEYRLLRVVIPSMDIYTFPTVPRNDDEERLFEAERTRYYWASREFARNPLLQRSALFDCHELIDRYLRFGLLRFGPPVEPDPEAGAPAQ